MFLTCNKEALIDTMIELVIGQRSFKIEKYLNERFYEYYDCLLLADSNAESQNACKQIKIHHTARRFWKLLCI